MQHAWFRMAGGHETITSREPHITAWRAMVYASGWVSVSPRDSYNPVVALQAINQDAASRIALSALDALLEGLTPSDVQNMIHVQFVETGLAAVL